ncbi:MAG: hypothetical protein WC890_03445 [Candidatus Margulisiibacteriota bacterium]
MRIRFLPVMLGMMAFSGCQQNEYSFARRICHKQSPTELLEVVHDVHKATNLSENQRLELYASAALKGKNNFPFYANPVRQRSQERALLLLASEIATECANAAYKEGAADESYLILSAVEEVASYLIVAMDNSFSPSFLAEAGNLLIALATTAKKLPASPGCESVENRIIYPALDKLVQKPFESRTEILAVKAKYETMKTKENKKKETASTGAPSSPMPSKGLRESKN